MSHIFISYSRRDIDFAQKIVDALASNNLDTWIDWKSIPKGEDWEQEIYRGIEEADAFLFLISPDSVTSEMCNKEIAHAIKNGKRILPIFIANVNDREIYGVTENFLYKEQKEEIVRRNFIKCREDRDNFDQAIEETRKTIHTDYGWLKFHTELQVKALKWGQKKDASRLLRGKELGEAEQQLAEISNLHDPQPTKIQREYLLTSRRQEERQRRQITIGLSLGIVVMAILSVVAWKQRNEAVFQQSISEAGNLASTALLHLSDKPDLSFLLGIEAFDTSDTRQSLDGLLSVLQSNPHLGHFLWSPSATTSVVAYSTDGKILASAGCGKKSSDGSCVQGEIVLWDVASGQLIGQLLSGHTSDVTAIGFSPNGKNLVSGSSDGTIILWNIATAQPEGLPVNLPAGPVGTIAFSPNGKVLALGSDSGTIILWNIFNRQVIGEPIYADMLLVPVMRIVFSPDGKTLASGNYDGSITLWDVDSHQPIGEPLMIYTSPVSSLAFSSDSKILAAGGCGKISPDIHDCFEGKIILWNVAEGQLIGEPLIGHSGSVFSVAFGSQDEILASGSYDGSIVLWNISSAQPLGVPLKGHAGSVFSLAFSPDGNFLVSISNSSIILWNINDDPFLGQPLIPDVSGVITSMAVSSNGKILAYGTNKGNITLWDSIGRIPIGHLQTVYSIGVSSLVFNPNNLILASGGCGIIKAESSACSQGKITLWDVSTGQSIDRSFNGLANSVSNLTFSPDGNSLASGSLDGTVSLWDVRKGNLISTLGKDLSNSIRDMRFSQDSRTLISASNDGKLVLWDVGSRQMIGQPIKFADNVSSMSIDQGGNIFANGNFDDTINLWNIETGQQIGQSLGQPAIDRFYYVSNVAFSPNGRILASAHCGIKADDAISCLQAKIILWDIDSGQSIGLPLRGHASEVSNLIFNPDAKTLVSSGFDGTLILWDLDPKSWITRACDIVRRNFTQKEWKQYFPNDRYRLTCPQWPAGQ